MNKSKVLVIIVLLLYALVVSFQFGSEDVIANALESIILPVITLLYCITVKRKSLFFTLFLVLFSLAGLMIFITPYIPYNIHYYVGNFLFILAYLFLVIEVFKSVSFSYIFKNYKLHLLILTVLNIYIIYVLQIIVDPYVVKTNEYYIELIYNIVMLLLLSGSLMNYFYRDNVKSLYLFLGSLSIVFAEVIWVAYTYISERYILNVVSTTLYLVAFYFFYQQSKIKQDIKREGLNMFLG